MKCSAYINNKCKNGYPDYVTETCGICYGTYHGVDWAPCLGEKFAEILYPETGSPLTEIEFNKHSS